MMVRLSEKEKTLRWALLMALLVVLLAVCAVLVAVASWQGLNEPIVKGGFPLNERWRFEADGRIVAEPSVGSGKVVIRTDKQLYALDVRTGVLLWTAPVQSGSISLPTPPLIGGDLVVVGYQSGVKALDAETGQVVWESLNTSCVGAAVVPAAMNETMVYVVRYSCNARAYDRATGAIVWEVPLPAARAAADLFLDQGRIYLVVTGDILLILDSATGSLIDEVRGQIDVPVTYYSGVLYGFREDEDENEELVAFDTRTRKTLWVGPALSASYSPLVVDERVFVPAHLGHPMAVDAQTGRLLWVAQTDEDIYQTPVVLGDAVYTLGIGDGRIYALSIQNGAELGYLYTGDKFVITDYSYNWRPVAAEGVLIVPLGRRVFAYGD